MMSATSTCPDCCQPTDRIHGRYPRTLADIPWATAPIALRGIVRRFRCPICTCRRQTCAERLPTIAPRYAHATKRWATMQAYTGLAFGGAAGARHCSRQGGPVSRNTLLRRVRRLTLSEGPAPHTIGTDAWARRKGHRYGTIIGDLARGCPIDVREDRVTETVATGLQGHPTVQVVARDRARIHAPLARPAHRVEPERGARQGGSGEGVEAEHKGALRACHGEVRHAVPIHIPYPR